MDRVRNENVPGATTNRVPGSLRDLSTEELVALRAQEHEWIHCNPGWSIYHDKCLSVILTVDKILRTRPDYHP
jgi:hypothetical protein